MDTPTPNDTSTIPDDQKSNDSDRISIGIFSVAVLWSIAIFLFQYFSDEMAEGLWLLNIVPTAITLLWGLCLIIWAIARIFQTRFRDRTANAVFCLMSVICLCLYHDVPKWLHWNLDLRPRYEKTIARLKQAPSNRWNMVCEQEGCQIDKFSPGLRVSFDRFHGVGYVAAIVYDPSGEITRAGQSSKESDRYLCQGFLSFEKPLGGPWHWCWFD